jgi:phospholipid/cholesterol/gamma-HCH transport system permease protein
MNMIKTTGREAVVQLHGRLDRTQAGRWWREVTDTLKATTPQHLVLDFRGVTGIDTAGVALLLNLEDRCGQQGIKLSHLHLPAAVGQFLGSWREHSSGRPIREVKPRIDPLSRLGAWGWQHLCEAYAFIRFLGDFLAAGPRQLMHPGGMHLREILYQIQFVGVGAVPLLVTMNLLLGALLVFQGIDTVRTFGQDIFIADIVVIAVTREMGPLLTALILAGRLGGAFAAEIGTMKLNEEIDALTVHNFDIIRFLVLPRVFALMLAAPLLTMISDAAGIIGGLLTSNVILDMPILSFLTEAQKALRSCDIYTGLIKGGVYGAFIALIGCFRGLRTGTEPMSLGIQTTSSVVTGIFVVIFFDTLLSYIFQMNGW